MVDVVVAEDDTDIRDLITMVLDGMGLSSVALPDGTGVLQACLRERPRLVLLDVTMPGQDGLATCRELRAEPSLTGLPIVMMTARARDQDVEAGREAGADAYVTKPFRMAELVEIVSAEMAGD